jgi:hypothetical protein
MSGGPGRRWWRRNWWGLAAVGPLLAAALVVGPDHSLDILRDEHTGEVIRPGGDGWVDFAGARLRLAGFGPAELFDDEGAPFRAPGLAGWQATLVIDPQGDPNVLLGCTLELADADGRRYPDGPAALGSAHDANGDGVYVNGCALPYDAPEDGSVPFETIAYFLLPESIAPVSLRVSHYTVEPDYVRLDVG